MPIRKKRTRAFKRGLTAYKLYELEMGRIVYPAKGYDGYGDSSAREGDDVARFISDEMRADWEAYRDCIMGVCGHTQKPCLPKLPPWLYPCRSRPWAWEQFDAKGGKV